MPSNVENQAVEWKKSNLRLNKPNLKSFSWTTLK
jgi:hypothetical protein